MIKPVYCVRKGGDMEDEEFHQNWLENFEIEMGSGPMP